MEKPTHEQIQASIKAEAHDCVGPQDPEAMRKFLLMMGASAEEADQSARFVEEKNRLWYESQQKAS